jgi:uncharacterized membrane protein YfbV (UPF0208 family)
VIFFYEFAFVAVAIAAIVVGEVFSRTLAVAMVAVALAVVTLGVWSFDARLATDTVSPDDRRWFTDARDGLKHLRLLLGLGALAALAWRLIAG